MDAPIIEITEFKPLTVIGVDRGWREEPMPRRRMASAAPAGIAVVLVHLTLLAALVANSRTVRLPVEHAGGQSGEAPRIEAVILPSDADEANVSSLALASLDLVTPPDPERAARLPAQIERALGKITADRGQEAQSRAGVEERERLRGLYFSQIGARVERVLNEGFALAEAFGFGRCRAQVLQSDAGELREVQFIDCGDDPDRLQQLRVALRAAAPLPAPPTNEVFTERLELDLGHSVTVRTSHPSGNRSHETR